MHYRDSDKECFTNATNQAGIAGGNVSFKKACLTQAAPASDSIVQRLRALRSDFIDLRMGVDRIADKIVGVSPIPPGCDASTGNVRVEPSCFLDSLQEVISDLEQVARETREHHERLLRSF